MHNAHVKSVKHTDLVSFGHSLELYLLRYSSRCPMWLPFRYMGHLTVVLAIGYKFIHHSLLYTALSI